MYFFLKGAVVGRKCILAEIVKDYSDFQPTGIALWRQVLVMLLRFVDYF